MKFLLPDASLTDANSSACCCRSSKTRQVLADTSSQLALMLSASRAIAESAAASKDASYGSVLMRAIADLNRSLSGHNAATTSIPLRNFGATELSDFPSTFSAKASNKSKFFIEGSPVGLVDTFSRRVTILLAGCNPHLYSRGAV